MDEEEIVTTNKDLIVTETVIEAAIPVEKVVAWLLARKTVGKLIFDMTQGRIQKTSLIETTKVTENSREAVRAAAGI